jgi:hypothetical protein
MRNKYARMRDKLYGVNRPGNDRMGVVVKSKVVEEKPFDALADQLQQEIIDNRAFESVEEHTDASDDNF